MPMRPSTIPCNPVKVKAELCEGVKTLSNLSPQVTGKSKAVAAPVASKPNMESSGGNKHPFIVILSKQQALDIYSMRTADTTSDPALKAVAGKSSMVAEMYGVSPKTIRDIWNRKTWAQVTRTMWTQEEADDYAVEQAQAKLPPAERLAIRAEMKKRRGRPPGSKDSRPRRRRMKDGDDSSQLEHTEGVMFVTIDGAVEVQPLPQAPRVNDIPEPCAKIQRVAQSTAQKKPVSVPVSNVVSQESKTGNNSSCHNRWQHRLSEPRYSDDHEGPGFCPGSSALDDGLFWTYEPCHEPGGDYDDEEPGCPRRVDEEAELHPQSLMGPIGDDAFEKAPLASPSPTLEMERSSRPAKFSGQQDDAHSQLLSMIASANSRETSPAVADDWGFQWAWLPTGADQSQSQSNQQQNHPQQDQVQWGCPQYAEPSTTTLCRAPSDSTGPAGPTSYLHPRAAPKGIPGSLGHVNECSFDEALTCYQEACHEQGLCPSVFSASCGDSGGAASSISFLHQLSSWEHGPSWKAQHVSEPRLM